MICCESQGTCTVTPGEAVRGRYCCKAYKNFSVCWHPGIEDSDEHLKLMIREYLRTEK